MGRLRVEIIGILGAALLFILEKTLRWKVLLPLGDEDFWRNGPHIFAFWHNQQIMMPLLKRHVVGRSREVATLVSNHQDGRMIARAVGYLGLDSVAGSSTRGGARGLLGLKGKLRDGVSVAVTPDGPRGPLYQAKKGVVQLAAITSRPVIPLACAASAAWRFNSWDRMILPRPFATLVGVIGEPLMVPENAGPAELEALTAELEKRLTALTECASSL